MSKFMPIITCCLLCWNAAFGGDITAGFSRDDAKNVVTDSIYKLMWQDGKDIFEGTYDEAVKYCENLNFAAYSDWRLPRIDEKVYGYFSVILRVLKCRRDKCDLL